MENLILVRTAAELSRLSRYLEDKDRIAFDTETTGVEKESEIIGFSVCAEEEVGYYVILAEWDVEQKKLVYLETKDHAKSFLQGLTTKSLILQNAPFDCSMVQNNFQVNLMPSVHTDTMIMAHLLNENRHNGLKELGAAFFGEDARTEQNEMKESVYRNGGVLTPKLYELYKADAELIGRYGAKDAILTLKLFNELVQQLAAEDLWSFFYDDESMPLLKGPTYDLNTTGLKVDPVKLATLKATLQAECMEAKNFVNQEIFPHVKTKYPGTGKTNHFNIGASKQLAWLLFIELGNEFNTLTERGKEVCKALELPIPYSPSAKAEFISIIREYKDRVYCAEKPNPKKPGKMSRAKKVADPWHYMQCGKESLGKLAPKYKWVARLLEYSKNLKLLNTYVEGIESRMSYNVIRPSFLQHGTTSGRYSSRRPNFQNLPRDDKRVKACIVARPGKVFVGADYAQLEPRVFASVSQDPTLMKCFESGEDFYSVVGAPIFGKEGMSTFKDDPNGFAKKFPQLRDKAKVVALATPYGRTAGQQAMSMGISRDEAQQLIDRYFAAYPKVELMMLESHEAVKKDGVVFNLYGRPRRIPEAQGIDRLYGPVSHAELPYQIRTLLNLGMNHRVQSTAASIMNRAAIACWKTIKELAEIDERWNEVKIVLQVHDELILEGPEALSKEMCQVLKVSMEDTVTLPGVQLIAEPKVGRSLAELK